MFVQAFLFVLLGMTVSSAPVQVQLPYYKLMTPEWLYKQSTITKPFTVYPKYLEIITGATRFGRLLETELVPPNVFTSTDSILVTMTIVVDTVLADSSDHDLLFGISDGTSFVGFETVDKGNYNDHVPCFNIEGDTTTTNLVNRVRDITGKKASSRRHSSETTIQIKPNDRWGSCHTEHDEGLVKIARYQRTLDITKGLYLQMYGDDPGEKYHIEYILVDIRFD